MLKTTTEYNLCNHSIDILRDLKIISMSEWDLEVNNKDNEKWESTKRLKN